MLPRLQPKTVVNLAFWGMIMLGKTALRYESSAFCKPNQSAGSSSVDPFSKRGAGSELTKPPASPALPGQGKVPTALDQVAEQ